MLSFRCCLVLVLTFRHIAHLQLVFVKNPPANTRDTFNPWVRKIPWRRKWQPTPVFLPGKSHGQRSLAGYSPWGCKRVRHDLATKHTHTQRWPSLQRLWWKTVQESERKPKVTKPVRPRAHAPQQEKPLQRGNPSTTARVALICHN